MARLWCNIGRTIEAPGLFEVFERLRERNPEFGVSLTVGRSVNVPKPLPDYVTLCNKPYDLTPSVDSFLTTHSPHATVLTSSDLFPSAITACKAKGVPVVLANAQLNEPSNLYGRLLDFQLGTRLRSLDQVLAISEEAANAFRRRGAMADRVEVTGELKAVPMPPEADIEEVDHLTKVVATRPVWLAAGVPPEEWPAIEAAQSLIASQSHRVLLILTPSDLQQGNAVRESFERAGWATAQREAGGEPDPEVQVYIADAPDEEGIWHRISPITYLGGTLSGKDHSDPYAPAALGSAVVYGNAVTGSSPWLEQLITAAACRNAVSAENLGQTVSDMLAPDRTAGLAARAWDVTTRGAAAVERTADLIHDILKTKAG